MIEAAHLEPDEGKWILVLEDDFGTHSFEVDPEMIDMALKPWHEHVAEGAAVYREYVASGRQPWQEYREAQARTDPEWAEGLRQAADHMRKYEREGASVDPGDETRAA
jgi:hypothetical protein